jgi:hypothetical protein
MTESDVAAHQVKRTDLGARALILAVPVLPVLAATLGMTPPARASDDRVEIARSTSLPVQAKDGTLLRLADARDVAFAQGARIIGQRMIAQLVALKGEFATIGLSTVLKPASLTDAAAIQVSRTSLKRVLSLVEKRNAILEQYFRDASEYLRTADIDEAGRRAAIRGFERGKPYTTRVYNDLGEAERASVAAVSDVLDFAESNLGTITVLNGELLFRDQASLDRYNALVGRVQAAAEHEKEIRKSLNELQATNQQ